MTLQDWAVVPFTLDCHEIRGWFRWKSKTQPDHHRLSGQSGDSTVDNVTTRQTRQKVSRNMFLPGACKPLPRFSSPRPNVVTLPSNTPTAWGTHTQYTHTHVRAHTHTHTLHVSLHVCTRACSYTCMHIYASSHTRHKADHAGEDVHKPHTRLNKPFHTDVLMHTNMLPNSHTQILLPL